MGVLTKQSELSVGKLTEAELIDRIVAGDGRPEDIERLYQISRWNDGTTICGMGDAAGYVELSDGPSGITATGTPHRTPIAVLAKRADVLVETAAALTVLARSVSEHADAALTVDPEGTPAR